jgi:2'-5' RNA ligase
VSATVRTIGVAVAIPEPWGTQLQDYRARLGDTTATMIPTHITLVPPTEVGDEVVGEIEDHLAHVAGGVDAYDVHLRGTGTFRPVSPVVFVAVVEGISQCEQLASAVRSGPLGVVDLAFPYHPHVTVAHHLDDEALDRAFGDLADFECRFTVDDFHLYVHDEDTGWRPTRDFGLRSAARR